jgi:hypothetical protein
MIVPMVILGIAAAGGIALTAIRISGKPYPPIAFAIVHGVVAAAGLVFLCISFINANPTALMRYAAVGLLIAAVGGLLLFFGFHLRKRPLPIPLIVLHGGLALTCYVCLWIGFLNSRPNGDNREPALKAAPRATLVMRTTSVENTTPV